MSLLERIYFFHAQIQENRFPNTTALIQEFEISQATAHRDIAYLRDRLLAPLAFQHQKNGFYYSRDDFRLPFENSPGMTLILGLLGNMAEESGLEALPELVEIRERLQGLLFPGRGEISDILHCEWVEKEPLNSAVFTSVLTALRERRQLRILYRSASGEQSKRTLDPLKLVNYQGRWYLLSWCQTRRERRMFHLARIGKATVRKEATEHVMKKEDNWLKESFGIFKGPASFRATLRLTGTAAEIVRHQHWHPQQQIQEEDNTILLTLPVADDRELIMKVLQFGSQAEVLSPKRLRKKLKKEIKGMIRLYRQ